MASIMLSFGAPVDVIPDDDNGYVAVCDKIPMLLMGGKLDGAESHIHRAFALVADYLISLGDDAPGAYLKRRGVDHTVIDMDEQIGKSGTPPQVLRYGGGVLVHGARDGGKVFAHA